jgi:ABC-2 type transport system permease protein
MKQIITLIVYDLRIQLRERGSIALTLVALALAGLGLFEGANFDRHTRRAIAAAQAQELQARDAANELAQRYFSDPGAAEFKDLQWFRTPIDVRGYAFREHVGFAEKPSVAGGALAIGQADLRPAYVRVRAESMQSALTAVEIEHPARLAAGRFDLAFVIVYLWPLALLALCSSVLTQDRESHRLRALRLQGVRQSRLLTAQVTARTLAASAMLLVFCAAGALLGGAVAPDGAGWSALSAWAGVVVLYSMFWGAVAIAICAVCGNRMTAAFAGFGAWLVLAIMLPAAATAVIQLAAPVPERERYVQAMRDAGDRVAAGLPRLERAIEMERQMAGVDRQFQQARSRRQELFDRALPFSPVTLVYDSIAVISGNDNARHQRFMVEVRQHQLRLRSYFQNAIQLATLGDAKHPCPSTCLGGYGFLDFDGVPRFAASGALSEHPQAPMRLAVLAVWIAALLVLAAALLAKAGRRTTR